MTPVVQKLLNRRIELPPGSILHLDPNLDRGKSTLTDWAGLHGRSKEKDLVNMLYNNGNFGSDSDSNGLADGLTLGASTLTYSLANNIQTLVSTATSGEHYAHFTTASMPNFSWVASDILYFCALVKSTIGRGRLYIYNRKSDGNFESSYSQGSANSGTFEFISVSLTVASKYTTPALYARFSVANASGGTTFSGAGEKIEVQKAILINKTACFGAGNEPTDAEMDTFIQANQYFWVTNHPRCRADSHQNVSIVDAETYGPNAIMVRKFTGLDYMYCSNNSNIDILTATTQKPFCIYGMFKANTFTGWIICKNNTLASDTQYGLFLNSATNKIDFYLDGAVRVSSNALETGKYHLFFAVWDGANAHIYINKQIQNSAAYAGTLQSRTYFNLGKRAEDEYFIGELGFIGISQGNVSDLNYWVDKLKMMQRFNIAA